MTPQEFKDLIQKLQAAEERRKQVEEYRRRKEAFSALCRELGIREPLLRKWLSEALKQRRLEVEFEKEVNS